ncbi:hypothetical protein [Shewanella aquimarina]|uniref:hypothetical protein n=1 Tax=Shewanella aquimarina TaxID=260365 RepID=UPI003204F8CA
MMKLLASTTLALASLLLTTQAFAERPDFSKTAAARADYRFADNPGAKQNLVPQSSSRHDFSKTTAANSEYRFADNPPADETEPASRSTQHDFSRTQAASKQS